MGSRANYVLVDGDGWRLYSSHWGASTLHRDLVVGPATAVAFVERQKRCDPRSGWFDDRWGEGGALIDLRSRHLVVFGGYGLLDELDVRRAYTRLVERTWRGWSVQWALDGLGDLVTYVGLDPVIVRVPGLLDAVELDQLRSAIASPGDLSTSSWSLVTVRTAQGLRWSAADGSLDHPVWLGPDLVPAVLAAGRGIPVPRHVPTGGVHVDVPDRDVAWWTAEAVPGLADVPARWPGWTVRFLGDRYESDAGTCPVRLGLPTVDLARGFDRIERDLAQAYRDPSLGALALADRLRATGSRSVQLSPAVRDHVHVDLDERQLDAVRKALAAARSDALDA